jgi:hypothetical protein
MELLPRVEEDVDAEEEDRDELEDAPVVADEVPELDVSAAAGGRTIAGRTTRPPTSPAAGDRHRNGSAPPEVSMLTDMPPRRPANCGAFKEA